MRKDTDPVRLSEKGERQFTGGMALCASGILLFSADTGWLLGDLPNVSPVEGIIWWGSFGIAALGAGLILLGRHNEKKASRISSGGRR